MVLRCEEREREGLAVELGFFSFGFCALFIVFLHCCDLRMR